MTLESTHISKYPNTFYRVSLKVVIRNEIGEVLVVKEGTSDTWSLPGGGWDHEETEHEALSRELKEEIGYEGDFQSSIFTTAVFWLESKQAWLLWILYNVETENKNFTAGIHSSEIAFINPKSFASATSFEEQWVFNNLS